MARRSRIRAPLLLLLLISFIATPTAAATAEEDKATTISSSGSGSGKSSSGSSNSKSKGKSEDDDIDEHAKAKRLALIFGRAEKNDADMENIARFFRPEQYGPTFYELGRVFTEGVTAEDGKPSVHQNLTRGLNWLVRSARDYGFPHAQHRLAIAYVTGLYGTPPPLPLAVTALPSADAHPPDRENDEEGQQHPSAEATALLLEQFAAMAGDVAGSMALGYRYLYGHGTTADCDKAVLYYEIAANAAIEELERLKVLPPNERLRLSDGATRRAAAIEADKQLVDYYLHTADKGDVGAQLALGKIYYHGSQGVPQNFAKAALYFEQAARAGDPVASGSIGQMYLLGVGVKQNNEMARRFFVRGQEAGDAVSLNGLGHLYMRGMGVERNVEKAVRYLQKAAHEKGHSESFYNLGLIYAGVVGGGGGEGGKEGGGGVGEKKPTAEEVGEEEGSLKHSMQRLDALKDDPVLAGLPAEMLEKLREITLQAAELERVAKETVEKGQEKKKSSSKAEAGVPEASVHITDSSSSGEKGGGGGTKKNLAKALKYFSLAAQTGHMGALHKLGQMYSQGVATDRVCTTAVHAFKSVAERGPWVTNMKKALLRHKQGDLTASLVHYIHLAEIGYEVAQSNAALLLEEGTCGLLSSSLACQALAVRYYRHASKQGNAEASLKVGDAYYYGSAGLPVDFAKAAKYYQTAAEARQPQAMFNLGLMHQYGVGLKQDFHLAKRFLDASAEAYPEAKWPVNLALIGLYVHWWVVGEDKSLIESPIVTTAPGVSVLVEQSVLAELVRAWGRKREQWRKVWRDMPANLGGGGGREGGGGGGEGWWEGLRGVVPAMDTLLIVLLSSAFLYVMRVRAEQREEMARRRRRQREEQQQQQQQQQQGQQVGGSGGGAGGGGGEAQRAHQD
jgi:SEL1 protein